MVTTPRKALTVNAVEYAIAFDRTHIAVAALDSLGAAHWDRLRERIKGFQRSYEAYHPCLEAFAPFTEALSGKAFTLRPLELVSIWGKLKELKLGYRSPGNNLARSLAYNYCTFPVKSGEWKDLCSLDDSDRFAALKRLKNSGSTNSEIFQGRLSDIIVSIKELKEFRRFEKETLDASASLLLGEVCDNVGWACSAFLRNSEIKKASS
jgi:hypothetical protein